MLFRLYIGSNNTTGKLETKRAIGIVSRSFDGFTVSSGSGYWQGKAEKSLIVEIETDKAELLNDTARNLCRELQQQAVGVAKIGRMEFIGL